MGHFLPRADGPLTAAVGRFLRQVGMGGVPNLFFGTDVFVLVLVLYDLAFLRCSWAGAWIIAIIAG
jgi:hypothetical protein